MTKTNDTDLKIEIRAGFCKAQNYIWPTNLNLGKQYNVTLSLKQSLNFQSFIKAESLIALIR